MDSTVRSIPSGQHCTHYSSNVPDALAQVEAWYRKALPDAKPDDINHQSLDDSFKLDG